MEIEEKAVTRTKVRPQRPKETSQIFSTLYSFPSSKSPSPRNNAFSSLWTKEEVRLLLQWKIPPEVLYEGNGGEMLTKMDEDMMFIYTYSVNLGLEQIVNELRTSELWYYKNTKENLAKVSERIDIGTGNGIVTNNMASFMRGVFLQARIEASADNPLAFLSFPDRVKLIASDLSHTSLDKAKFLVGGADERLGEIFDLEYIPEKFQQILAKSEWQNKHRLITMFNFLANFEEAELKTALSQVHQTMTEKDVFIPSFFQYKENFNTIHHQKTTLGLYDNPETENRIVKSFEEKYHPTHTPEFEVHWIQEPNGNEQPYIEVTLLFPEDTLFTIDTAKMSGEKLPHTDDGRIKFTAFKSYRMSKAYLTNLLEESWFGIDGRLESDNRLQIAPVLYKKSKI